MTLNAYNPASNQLGYNGKEQQNFALNSKSLDWLDYGMRFYNSQLGVWHSIDPMASENAFQSPYNFCSNNPINRIDPDGADDFEDDGWIMDNDNGTAFWDKNINTPEQFANSSYDKTDFSYMGQTISGTDEFGNTLYGAQNGHWYNSVSLAGVTCAGYTSPYHYLFTDANASEHNPYEFSPEEIKKGVKAEAFVASLFVPAGEIVEAARIGVSSLRAIKAIDAVVVTGTKALNSAPAKLTQEVLEHIVERHWFTSGAKGAGKFVEGTTARGLKEMIETTSTNGLFRANTFKRAGTIAEYNFGRVIGTTSSGAPASSLRVVIGTDGNVITAFPF
jgi:RHS repeat-associated protein